MPTRRASRVPTVAVVVATTVAALTGYVLGAFSALSRCDGDGGTANADPGSPADHFCSAHGPILLMLPPILAVAIGTLVASREGSSFWIWAGLAVGILADLALAAFATQLSFQV